MCAGGPRSLRKDPANPLGTVQHCVGAASSWDEHLLTFCLINILSKGVFQQLTAEVTLQGFAPFIVCRRMLPGVRTQPEFSCGMHLETLLVWAVFAGHLAARSPSGTAPHPTVAPPRSTSYPAAAARLSWGSSPRRGDLHRCCLWSSQGELSRAVPASWLVLFYFSLMETHLLFYITV